jgi:formate hydrogenlyase transcriptional activator
MDHPPAALAAERYRTLLEINNAIISSLTREALFHAIAGALRRVVPFDRTAVFLHEPARDVLRLFVLESSLPSAYFGVGLEMAATDSHVGRVFQKRQPLIRHDLATEREYAVEDQAYDDGVRSYVIVPLVARDTAIGVLAVASTRARQYSDADIGFLQEVANQVALAVENMKAYEAISALEADAARAAKRYRTLLEINNAIISSLTEEALFQAIARALRPVVPFDRSAILLHESKRNVLRVSALEGPLLSSHFVVGADVPLADSPAGWVFEHRQPLLRRDLATEREYPAEVAALQDGVRAVVIAPLMARGRVIGTLSLASAAPGQYSNADAELVREVATQVALAVENMTAYGEIDALKRRLEAENVYLQDEIRRTHHFDELVGGSPALLDVLERADRVAATDTTVLILGETGTGKELIARALHDRGARKDRPLVKVNCGAIAAGLVESELFGHAKGAFTGAIERHVGRFELADGGTLFLDEVSELPLETQVKLLRVLQEQEFEPVGSSRTVRVDVRIIAATNRDLEEVVRAGRFRSDLYYRLAVVPLRVPPLRERQADIPQLAMLFLERFARRFGKAIDAVSQETMARLVAYPWPGNVRELQNVIERGVVLSTGRVLALDPDLLPMPEPVGHSRPTGRKEPKQGTGSNASIPSTSTAASLQEVERQHILSVLARTRGVIEGKDGAARVLDLHPNTLRSRMKKLGIDRRRRGIS